MPDSPLPAAINIRSADDVIAALRAGTDANLHNPTRRGSIERISAPGELLATGDLHDNPAHMARLFDLALIDPPPGPGESPSHLLLHELIHPDDVAEEQGAQPLDFSYRALVRAAAAKALYPTHIHTLLANHELAQIAGLGIVKNGVNVVRAFNDGVAHIFGAQHREVTDAINAFIRSMPLAIRWVGGCTDGRDVLCAHSLPSADLIDRFDPTILERDWTEDDTVPRRGSAHLLVWGRDHTDDLLNKLADRWNVGLFILGHEKAPAGTLAVGTRAVVLNTDHAAAIVVPLNLSTPVDQQGILQAARPLFS